MPDHIIVGGDAEMVGKTPTNYDCAALVKRIRPYAKGMTFSPATMQDHAWKGTSLCWARYNTVLQHKTSDYESCLFQGKLTEK